MKKKLVFSTGAGMSAESGIQTFRDAGGLWENYPVMEVASHTGYVRNPALIHKFYSERRKQLLDAKPNAGHLAIAALEAHFDVHVITQNVDDLHERAGSTKITHLHGELMKMRAVDNENLTFDLSAKATLNKDTLTYRVEPEMMVTTPATEIEGHLVRPHIVFFEEAVPEFEPATKIAVEADIFVIIGTSLAVYPAAALLNYVRPGVPVYYIDPNPAKNIPDWVTVIPQGASEGLRTLTDILLKGK